MMDLEPRNDDAATDDDTETVYAYCSRYCDMCDPGGFLAFEMCLEDRYFNDDMSIDHGEPNDSENDANEPESESEPEQEPGPMPEPEPEQSVSNVEENEDEDDTDDHTEDAEFEDDESENEDEDEDADRPPAVGCPNPRNPQLRWYKCALCPKMDFCATCYLTHEHQCAPGPCHAADDRCHNCAQDVDEDLPCLIPVVFSRPKRPTPQLSS
jgi:hypothetical protein